MSEPWQAVFLIALGLFSLYCGVYAVCEYIARQHGLTDDERAWDAEVSA